MKLPSIGTEFEGGYFAGTFNGPNGKAALIAAPKLDGEFVAAWDTHHEDVLAARSQNSCLENTRAMAAAGSPIAKQVLALRIGGHDDWAIPSVDALNVLWEAAVDASTKVGERALRERKEDQLLERIKKRLDARESEESVANLRKEVAALREAGESDVASVFEHGGAQAFAPTWYWTSTQFEHPAGDHAPYAFIQHLGDGAKNHGVKESSYWQVRAVRVVPVQG